MFFLTFLAALFSASGATAEVVTSALSARSWNCCKSPCSWPGVADVRNPVMTCDANDAPLQDFEKLSSCDNPSVGGTGAYTGQHAWQHDNGTPYGLAGAQLIGEDQKICYCSCYILILISSLVWNRSMVVQTVSMISGVESSTSDLQVCFPYLLSAREGSSGSNYATDPRGRSGCSK